MSVLVLLIPPRVRLAAHAADGAEASASSPGEGYHYVLSSDGLQVSSHGRAQLSLLPRADLAVAVIADSDLSWQRLTLPKAPAGKLRAALGGLLEDHLLEDDEALHLALAPGAQAGEPVWVAAMHKAWLRGEMEKLEKGGLSIERVLPLSWPGDTPQGHFFESTGAATGDARIMLCHADEAGLSLLRLDGSLARALLSRMNEQPTLWTAEPAVAAAAERWLGSSVKVQTEAERALQATRSLWNLRQFDLAPRHRGTRALRNSVRQFLSPAWRPVRIGLATLLLLQLVGLNAWAWHQRQALVERRLAQEEMLRATFPNVRAVLDAPLQMRRETEVLRAAAGRAGDSDLEALLGAAASAWPDGQGPVQALRFEPGRLTLSAPGWSEQQVKQFRDRLRPGGWTVESAEGSVSLSRAPAPGARS
ncbi:MAG: type II secretion system protein GspL [Burkholderiaceae bacterium]|jgi:general secretion pathway protein L|nr:type II secretion system protein GspL [Burkholderiaceae bacterium]